MIDPTKGEQTQKPQTTFRPGIVQLVGASLQVNVGGSIIPARWADPTVVVEGDAVLVAFMSGPTGQSDAVVMFRTTARPRPSKGTVTSAPAGSPTISVTTSEGVVTAEFVASYTPVIGNIVLLSWDASTATVVGKVGSTPAASPPPSGPAAPPGPASSGSPAFAAIDSATYEVGAGWNTRTYGSDVVQGPYGGRTSTGSWFYGTSPSSIAGRTLVRAQIYIPARRRQGDWNSPATLHLYAHTSASRPAGEPARTAGPFDIVIPPGFGGGWISIPVSLAAVVVAGGGISIAGSPYAGVVGRTVDAQSGTLIIDWSS